MEVQSLQNLLMGGKFLIRSYSKAGEAILDIKAFYDRGR